jgi:hypothetical protein
MSPSAPKVKDIPRHPKEKSPPRNCCQNLVSCLYPTADHLSAGRLRRLNWNSSSCRRLDWSSPAWDKEAQRLRLALPSNLTHLEFGVRLNYETWVGPRKENNCWMFGFVEIRDFVSLSIPRYAQSSLPAMAPKETIFVDLVKEHP